jgi:glycolate oxidase FAD binding subunit
MASIPSEVAAALLSEAPFDGALSVDGLVPGGVVAPSSGDEVAAVLAEAGRRGLAVAPVGGATKLTLGNVPRRLDLALSTRNLGGVIAYEPTDLVLSVGAGARLADVQAVLAEHGQALPIDPPDGGEATIGGLIATAIAGPRRFGNPTLRDLLIGIAVAHPSGTVTKAGGMVVKNVSGFDLPRVYLGSLGTLGVVVSANFKVLPAPRRDATLLAAVADLASALAAAAVVRAGRVRPAALEVVRTPQCWGVAVRLDARPETVEAVAAEVEALLPADRWRIEGAESAAWWAAYTAAQSLRVRASEAVIRSTVRPREIDALATGLVAGLADLDIEPAAVQVSAGLGTIHLRLSLPGDGGRGRFLAARDLASALADHAVVLAAPPGWKQGIDVWGEPPETLSVMRSLKQQFDPDHVLNPGRFVGGI